MFNERQGDGMKVMQIWDEHNYNPHWRRFIRRAARAVILAGDGRIAMVKSRKEGFYKFPGGGLKKGESRVQALIRETREEAGLEIIPSSVRELGMFWEIRKSVYDKEIFDQRSYYYIARAKRRLVPQQLEPYEKSLGFELAFVPVCEAYRSNTEVAAASGKNNFLLRETKVLQKLMERGIACN